MIEKEDEFLKRLLETFKTEAEEHLRKIASELIELEKCPVEQKRKPIIEQMFREAHSLKGAARAVNMNDIEKVSQSIEGVFAAMKEKTLPSSPEIFDILHHAIDILLETLTSPSSETIELSEIAAELAGIGERGIKKRHVEKSKKSTFLPPGKPLKGLEVKPPSTVRIAMAKLDSLLRQAEEMLSTKLFFEKHVNDLRETKAFMEKFYKRLLRIETDIKVKKQKTGIISSNELLEFLEWERVCFKSLDDQLKTLIRTSELNQHAAARMIDDMLDDAKKVSMLPFSTVLFVLPRMVRDLSRDRGKDIDLKIEGEEIEIDKRILEEIKDPLICLVRNSIDHGIEMPELRKKLKKPPHGSIVIKVAQTNSSKVEITVKDDGRGVDTTKVLEEAKKKGLFAKLNISHIDEYNLLSIISYSGISTSPTITEISGRGLGLAIVREKIEKLGGTLSLKTKAHIGTSFRVVLPSLLSTLRGVMVRIKEQIFAIPTINVQKVLKVQAGDIKPVENRETISVEGVPCSLVRLSDILGIEGTGPIVTDKKVSMYAVVLRTNAGPVAFVVDEILNEQELLVKGLGKQLRHVKNIAGTALLGSGRIVPILNIRDLAEATKNLTITGTEGTAALKSKVKRAAILVVEDSITARVLLKNILEAAGYIVKTAVDGLDGLTQLKTNNFDLVVSDIDMPRMNGFTLTSKIRHDNKLSEIPVILVTALESKEDRERGIDVGANAYIIKKSFDQSNLLEAIRRLI